MLVKQMIDSMWSTVPKEGVLSGSREEELYRDMLNEAIANSIAEGKGMGIKDVILKDINKLSKNK
jgi:Rod binding domain-containing protein